MRGGPRSVKVGYRGRPADGREVEPKRARKRVSCGPAGRPVSKCVSLEKMDFFLLTKWKRRLKVSKVPFEEWFPDGRRPWRSASVWWERNRSCSRHQRNVVLR